MDLSVAEAARLLGCSPRTLRRRITAGELRARRAGRSWTLRRDDLPLTVEQHAAEQARADAVRSVVDDALPSRVGLHPGDRRRSLADAAAFRRAAGLSDSLAGLPEPLAAAIRPDLEQLIEAFAEASFLYDAAERTATLNRARRALGRCAGRLVQALRVPPDPRLLDMLGALEREIYPALVAQARAVALRGAWAGRR